ncbi:uncharacterized protein LOC141903307 [Tubulanus polymorphus]|uniref:uncharacterized protein LOC141903307 n=1 Tax=Tubulanus polymorphus TaxID=672921 RepID=UPI003DA65E6B
MDDDKKPDQRIPSSFISYTENDGNNRQRSVSYSKHLDQVVIDSQHKSDQIHTGADELPMNKHDIIVASTLVKDALYGRNMGYKTDPLSIKSYQLFNHPLMRAGLGLALLIDLSIAIFEKPAVRNADLPYWASMLMEMVCLMFFLFRFLHALHFDDGKFWRDKKNIIVLVCIILTWLDMICFIIWANLVSEDKAIRWSRPLRPLFIINFSDGRQVRRAFRNIRRTLIDILNVLILFMLCIGLFALLALKLFDERNLTYPNGDPYFQDYLSSFWDLYVLVTTANSPDVMMPAFDSDPGFSVFFVIYSIICNYIFMSILLAVIYNNYRKHLKNEVKASVYAKRHSLSRAFDILKVSKDGKFVITQRSWHELMKVVKPKRSYTQIKVLLYVLDSDGDDCLTKSDFLQVVDLLNVRLSEVKDRLTFCEMHFPGCYMSKSSELIKGFVQHIVFRYFFDVAIIANAVCIAISAEDAEWFFLGLFTIEIVLKIYAVGFYRFFQKLWNLFDFLVIGAAIIATSIEAMDDKAGIERITLDILLVLRVLRLLKIMQGIERFRVILLTIINIGPSILTYGVVLFIFYYIYAIIGMELYGGLIKYNEYNGNVSEEHSFCGNTALNNSDYYKFHYCGNNFNNILHSLIVLFELMYVNQWHVITQGFVLVTNVWARIYFISFHMICVLLVLNIFVAFVLEVFILEYNLSKGKFESAVEQTIKEMGLGYDGGSSFNFKKPKSDKADLVKESEEDEDAEDNEEPTFNQQTASSMRLEQLKSETCDQGLKFHLRKSKKNVEALLMRMFEDELEPEDFGPLDDDDADEDPVSEFNF